MTSNILSSLAASEPVSTVRPESASAAAWPSARHMRVEGLGHGRILADPVALAPVIRFITTNTH